MWELRSYSIPGSAVNGRCVGSEVLCEIQKHACLAFVSTPVVEYPSSWSSFDASLY